MTTIAGIVDKDRVLIGSDSQYTVGYQQHTGPTKIFRPSPGWLMGVAGSYKMAQLLQYGAPDGFFERDSNSIEKFIMTSFSWRLLQFLEKNKVTSIEEGTISYDGAIMVAVENKLFVVGSDFSVLPIDDFAAIGSGKDYAYGASYVWQDIKSKEERLIVALGAACHYDIYTTGPTKIRSTK